jgi:small subunit ribosomal protein S1
MSNESKDRLRQYMPSDDEIERAMEEALRQAAASGGIPSSGPELQSVRPNTLIKGRVIHVDQDRVAVDLTYKAEGIVAADEFGTTLPSIGDEIEAWVMRMEDANGQVQLSVLEAQRRRISESVGEGARQGAAFRGKVVDVVKGGVVVDIGVRAFMPARECDIRFMEDLEVLRGRDVEVKVIEADPGGRHVVVSRRVILREEREKKREALYQDLAEGQVRRGVVSNITDFGAFIDIGGAEGLVHKGDLAWGRVEKVTDVVQLGQEVEVVVLKFDRQADKISLGLRQAGPSPWDHAAMRYAPGNRAKGRVVGLLDFGAVVEFEPGIQGLVHVSEMRWGQRVRRPQDVVELGDEVEVEVLTLDTDKRKLSLSMKKVEENPWVSLDRNYPFATIVRGTVTRIEDFGVFVALDDDDLEGLVHISELSWTERVGHPSEKVKEGDHVTAIVIGTDAERQRLSLSIRQTEPDPWWDVEQRLPAGKVVSGKVVRLKDFGAFVDLGGGLEGLVHVSNMGEGRVNRPKDVVKIGQSVTVEVIESSEQARRLALRLVQGDEDGED